MRTVILAAVIGAAFSGCTDRVAPPPAPTQEIQTEATGTAERPLSVEEALRRRGVVTVRGGLIAEDGVVRLCDVTNDGYPPSCVEPFLEVEGVDIGDYPSQEAEGVRFTHGHVTLTGRVLDGELLVVRDG